MGLATEEMITRSLDSLSSVRSLNNYACWCYFTEETYSKGKGVPMDAYDAECKKYNQGFQCIMMEDSTCAPYSQVYNGLPNLPLAGLGLAVVDIETECNVLNAGNDCQINTCIVESSFILEVTKLSSSGSAVNVTSFHSAGFPIDTSCTPVQGGQSGPRDACCGDFPHKFPFRTMGGLQECCADGKIRATGGC